MLKRFLFIFIFGCIHIVAEEKRIVVVTASYNNSAYYKRMLDSVFSQKYENWHLIYVDDCSPDETGNLVEAYVQEKEMQQKVTLIKNEERTGRSIENQYKAIYQCANTDIIIILDGDDWLAHDTVLAYINDVYADSTIWLTYGQFKEYPSGHKGFCLPMPRNIVDRNAFREHPHIPSHLRTFYAGLFKKIKKEDLMHEGHFFEMTGDMAAMLPMIEMARHNFKFIPDILLMYNMENPLNDHKISEPLQRGVDKIIRGRQRYEKIENPFAEVIVTEEVAVEVEVDEETVESVCEVVCEEIVMADEVVQIDEIVSEQGTHETNE